MHTTNINSIHTNTSHRVIVFNQDDLAASKSVSGAAKILGGNNYSKSINRNPIHQNTPHPAIAFNQSINQSSLSLLIAPDQNQKSNGKRWIKKLKLLLCMHLPRAVSCSVC